MKKYSDLVPELKAYVAEYRENWGRPISLNIVNKRFGLRFKEALGCSVKEFVQRREDLFECKVGENGGLTIEVRRVSQLEYLALESLKRGPKTFGELAASLSGSGFMKTDLMDLCVELEEVGLIKIEDGVYSLVTVD